MLLLDKYLKNKDNLKKKILVVGDVMLDKYWFGDVNRISPEAPVPIAKINVKENRAGGAANVARNIASIKGDVSLLSIVGDDEAAKELEQLLNQDGIKHFLKIDKSIDTIVKLRVIARNQQLIRLDFETSPQYEILLDILDYYTQVVDNFDIILLSDYGKGGLTHIKTMIEIANKLNKIILVDPKGNDYERYRGATLLTPNKSELRDAVGFWNNEKEMMDKAIQLRNSLDLKYLLITRSEEGMSLILDKNIVNYPTVAKEVYDVSGAGDTVIATLATMLACDFEVNDAVTIANIAAGIVVGKLGTATINDLELLEGIKDFAIISK
jgi:rfaE bifunctional protein kinase chain/domain